MLRDALVLADGFAGTVDGYATLLTSGAGSTYNYVRRKALPSCAPFAMWICCHGMV